MKMEKFEGKWNQLKQQVQEKWAALTTEDLNQIDGDKDVLLSRLRLHYGYNKEEAARQLEGFVRDCTVTSDTEWRSVSDRGN